MTNKEQLERVELQIALLEANKQDKLLEILKNQRDELKGENKK